jgi:putative acetyltransferase
MRITVEDPATPDVRELLEEHLRDMRMHSPPESVHALDVRKLQQPEITFWTVRDGALLLGCGALKQLGPAHGEIKSMRTPTALRRQGAGRAMLAHIISIARERGYERLSLETGSMDAFLPAQRLYQRYGFTYCEPFGDYWPDPNSLFMTLRL